MNLIGTYQANLGELTLEITKADNATGELGGTLVVNRTGIPGYSAKVEGHYHFLGSLTSLAFFAWSDDLEGENNYFAWAGYAERENELVVSGGHSVVTTNQQASAKPSEVTRFIRK
ncbi:MAG: hypothetical protein AAGD38_05720 [Acidobacteriota bacterium]